MKIRTKKDRRERIQLRQRKRITGTAERPRLAVFRSAWHIYAQVIDDMAGTTVAAAAQHRAGAEDDVQRQGARRQPGGRRGARPGDRGAAEGQGHHAASCSTAAATCITGGFARSPTRRAKPGWSSEGRWRMLTRKDRSVRARAEGHGGVHQPRDQGRQGRQEPELQRARRRSATGTAWSASASARRRKCRRPSRRRSRRPRRRSCACRCAGRRFRTRCWASSAPGRCC